MLRQLAPLAAVFISAGLVHFAHGGGNALLVFQMRAEGYSEGVAGWALSFTYLGIFVGATLAVRLVRRVSYIRGFVIGVAVMTANILLFPFLLEAAAAVFFTRFLYGAALGSVLVIAEGWLNSTVESNFRARAYAALLLANYLMLGLGQLLISLPYAKAEIFSFAALGGLLAILPIALTRYSEPMVAAEGDDGGGKIRAVDAYRAAPLAMIGIFSCGLLLSLLPLIIPFALSQGFDAAQASIISAVALLSGFVFQVPIGSWSDRAKDRRNVILFVVVLSTIGSALLAFAAAFPWPLLLFLLFLHGGMMNTIYPLCLSFGNDFVSKAISPAYCARLQQAYAFGAILGPPVAGGAMSWVAPNMLFVFMTLVCGSLMLAILSSKIMPRFRPARAREFYPASPLASANPSDFDPAAEPAYTEVDVGPAPPSPSDVGSEGEPSAESGGGGQKT